MEEEKIIMQMDDGSEIEITILEKTTLGGVDYILVTDAPEDEDGECYVMRDISEAGSEEAVYESVEDEDTLNAVYDLFKEKYKGILTFED